MEFTVLLVKGDQEMGISIVKMAQGRVMPSTYGSLPVNSLVYDYKTENSWKWEYDTIVVLNTLR